MRIIGVKTVVAASENGLDDLVEHVIQALRGDGYATLAMQYAVTADAENGYVQFYAFITFGFDFDEEDA